MQASAHNPLDKARKLPISRGNTSSLSMSHADKTAEIIKLDKVHTYDYKNLK